MASASETLEAMRAREREAASRRQKLQEQAEQLSLRAGQLDRGAAALRKGMMPGDAADLPDEALRSFASRGAPQRIRAEKPDTRENERAAELTVAKQKQQLADTYARQQQQAQEMNARRLALQRQSDALEQQQRELKRRHAQQRAAFRASVAAGMQADEDVVEELEVDESGAGGAASGPPSPLRAAEQVDTEAEIEEEDDEAEAELRPVESATAVRARYLATYKDAEQSLRQRELAYRASLAEREQQEKRGASERYRGELGPTSYRSDQLEAYKAVRSVAEELVGEALVQLESEGRHGPSVPQLEHEYANWKDSHRSLRRRVKRQSRKARMVAGGAGAGVGVGVGAGAGVGVGVGDDGSGSSGEGSSFGDDEEEVMAVEEEEEEEGEGGQGAGGADDDEGRRFNAALRASDRLDAATLWNLAGGVLEALVVEEVRAVAEQVQAERGLASTLARRLVLGSVARAAGGGQAADVSEELTRMLRDMTSRQRELVARRQPGALHTHRNNLTVKWRGRRPRKPKHDDDSSSSSSDDDDDEEDEKLGGVLTLALDEAPEAVASSLLRGRFVSAEGLYWRHTRVDSAFLPCKDAFGEPAVLRFAPSGERTLLAAGTQGGGVLVWHVDAGPTPTPLRRCPRVRSEAPNSVLGLAWSLDGTELAAVTDDGISRVWTVASQVPSLTSLSSKILKNNYQVCKIN